ncbi:MAG TPA: bifunctional phosphoglucose/phosphomannose isomerase [Thermoleophilaceae bacterium]|nr:bifunctional phosphoglucose/phosphomannose isomerase [Thermoleophilaceae bacterium]
MSARRAAAAALDPDAIERADPHGMVRDVLDLPGQLGDALWRVESARVPRHERSAGLVVCGMGGSAIGGDLAAAILGGRALRPIRTVRGYDPGPTGPDALVLCASYSGETEETLACFEAAGEAGAARVALTTGGTLAEHAREASVPVIGAPSGMQPRAAVAYMTLGALECAAACGAAPSLGAEVEAAAGPLAERAREWGPEAGAESLAKELAARLRGTLPIVYGAGRSAAVARRWKTQLNENAEVAAFFAALPEADHNEICGFDQGARLAPLAAVFLDDPDDHPRIARRVELTAAALEAAGIHTERVPSPGATPAERLLSQVLLGDLVSVYLAVLSGVDPTPVEPIERFKALLGKP